MSTASNHSIYAQWTANTYTVTLNTSDGYFGDTTEINTSFKDQTITLAANTNVPLKTSATLSLSTNVTYLMSFDFWSDGFNKFNVDLHPDTLPEISPESTTTRQSYNWLIQSSNSDMSKAYIRFFNDKIVPNPYNIYIENIHLYTCANCTRTTTMNVIYDNAYGTLPTPKKNGYTFLGWYTTGGAKIESTTKVSTGSSHTLYAQWKIIDTTAPTITEFYAKGYVGGNTITAILKDDTSLDGYHLTNNTTYSCSGTTPTSWTTINDTSFNLTVNTAGHNSMYLWVKDSAGNTTCSEKKIYLLTYYLQVSEYCTVDSAALNDTGSVINMTITNTCANTVPKDEYRTYFHVQVYTSNSVTWTFDKIETGSYQGFAYMTSSGWANAYAGTYKSVQYNGLIYYAVGYRGTNTKTATISKIVADSTTIYNGGFVQY